MRKAIFKVPNGKLLKIFLEDRDGKISSIKITGDFFLHPEENLELLEEILIGTHIQKENLVSKIQDFVSETKTVFFGIDGESLAHTILQAFNSPQQ